jgi:hypothetical protein
VAARRLPRNVQERLRDVRDLVDPPPTYVPVGELERVYDHALARLIEGGRPIGDYLEFGVFRGDSFLCMDRVRRQRGLSFRLVGFDSFQGLPELAAEDAKLGWEAGWFHSDYERTRRRLSRGGIDWDHASLVKGWYDETLTPELRSTYLLRKASTIMVDCDLYSSTQTVLRFVAPLILDEAIVFFDDWDGGRALAERGEGEARAFQEFLVEHPELSSEEFDTYYHLEEAAAPVAKAFRVWRTA